MKKITLLVILLLLCDGLQAQTAEFIQARTDATSYITANNLVYNKKFNTYTGRNDDVIHIFMYEDGNLLIAGYPTTATEKSKFQLHLFVQNTNRANYLLEYTGSYSPILNIQNVNTNPVVPVAPVIPGVAAVIVIDRMDFAVLGPFTETLVMTIKTSPAGGANYTTLTSSTIKISKTFYASIGSGIVYTSLKDPQNIRTLQLPNGDTTLIADNFEGRSLLTVMATFYPWGRNNLMLPNWNFKDRFGIVVGTTIGSQTATFKNLLVGAQYDFSIGGSIVAGLHYGQRQKIVGVDYDDFEFGKTVFTGNLEEKKYTQGNVGFFIGLAIDTRIFSQLFK